MKDIFTNYINRHSSSAPKLPLLPYAPISIVIPCYDEEHYIAKTLTSIWDNQYKENVHIIVVINQNRSTSPQIKSANKRTELLLSEFRILQKHKKENFHLSVLNETFSKASTGVGTARKIGMDEAIKQYAAYNKDGIIASLDADTLCASNYLTEIAKHYQQSPDTNGAVLNYAHRLKNADFEQSNAMTQYEIYLRYMTFAYRYIGHPNAFHTIGSAFTVKASAYCKQGGMNQRQAGEDFYFLQKIFDMGNCSEINTTCVYPSGRISNRVPFGTGKAIAEIIENKNIEFQIYDFRAFMPLKKLIALSPSFFKRNIGECKTIAHSKLATPLAEWLDENSFFKRVAEINKNTATLEAFTKRFFTQLSILQIIKYLNSVHQKKYFTKKNILEAIKQTPYASHINFDNYMHLLNTLRTIQIKYKSIL